MASFNTSLEVIRDVASTSATENFIRDWLAAAPAFFVMVELRAMDDKCVSIENFQTWPLERRNQGEATRALETLCRLADIHNVALCGDVPPYTDSKEGPIRLRLWLARKGFHPTSSKADELQVYRAPHAEYHVRPAMA